MSTAQPPDDSPPRAGAGGACNPPTSPSLLQRARADDQEAWRRLYYLYRPFVLYWCSRWRILPDDAEDVVQEVFRGVAGGLAGFHHDRQGDTFRGWLRGITRNQVLLHFRRRQGHEAAAGGSGALEDLHRLPDPVAGKDEPAEELSGLYHRALELVRGEFEERTWQMFWRAVIDSRPPAAVAAELGVSAAAVRQAKSRVLRRLKEEAGDLLP